MSISKDGMGAESISPIRQTGPIFLLNPSGDDGNEK